jgi:uncharacterized protein (DUF1697 family)
MPIHIALLRGINVGGRNMVAMSDLRDLSASLGLRGTRTLLQSGNLIFENDRRTASALERLLELETKKRLDVSIDYVVRTLAEWETIVASNPFPKEAKNDPSHLVVMFLKAAPEPDAVKALQAAVSGPEIVRADGKQLYITYPAGIGDSKLTNVLIEKTLDRRGTGRNWNTVLKLAALASE